MWPVMSFEDAAGSVRWRLMTGSICEDVALTCPICCCRVLAQGGVFGNSSSTDLLASPHLQLLSCGIPKRASFSVE